MNNDDLKRKGTPESGSPDLRLNGEERRLLLNVARTTIERGLESSAPVNVAPDAYPASLQVPRAAFVTLRVDGELQGCVGSLEPERPLVSNVAYYAHQAAFHDPRFRPLCPDQWPGLAIQISVLSPLQELTTRSEDDVLAAIQPGTHGVFLAENTHRGTLLPSAWRELRDPERFLKVVKRKAGLPEDHWSNSIRVFTYTTESFEARPGNGGCAQV